jgi:hypothetical protein
MRSPPRVRKDTLNIRSAFRGGHGEYKNTAMHRVTQSGFGCLIHVSPQDHECTRLATLQFALYANTGCLLLFELDALRSVAHVREKAQAQMWSWAAPMKPSGIRDGALRA